MNQVKKRTFGISIRKYEIAIASGILILVILLLSRIFLYPNIQKAIEVSTDGKNMETDVTRLKKKESQLLVADKTEYSQALSKLKIILPDSKDYVSLFTTFDGLQELTGALVVRSDFQLGEVGVNEKKVSKTPGKAGNTVKISLQIQGSYDQILKFLSLSTGLSGRILTIESMQLGYEKDGLVTANLTGYGYYQPIASSQPKPLDPLPVIDGKKAEIFANVKQVRLDRFSDDAASGDLEQTGKKDLFN